MKSVFSLLLFAALTLGAAPAVIAPPNTLASEETAAGWRLLFDGTSLAGWKASDQPGTFSVTDGCIVTAGPRSHLYYDGPVQRHDFGDFELRLEVMTSPGANSGVYFHTTFQETDWPSKGYEVQVNNSASDLNSRTGELFAVQDTKVPPAADNTWFTLRIRVEGRRVQTWVDGNIITDYVEKPGTVRRGSMAGWLIGRGTFALQAHDPGSHVRFRSIAVRPLDGGRN